MVSNKSLADIFVRTYSSSFILLVSVEYMVLERISPFLSIGVKLSAIVEADKTLTGSFFTAGLEFTFLNSRNIYSHMSLVSNSTQPG